MDYALPLLAAADTALYHLMLLFGLRPGAIAGHSTAQDLALGAAANADTLTPETIRGATTVEDRLIEQWVRDLVPAARLLSVGASTPERVAALAAASGGALRVAMDNCPNQVVLCGGPEAVDRARATLEAEGALCQFLPFDRAYHTEWYRPVCDRLDTITGGYEHLVPRIPFYCTTTGQRAPADPAALRRLMIDQWAEPIRFRETIETMYADGARLFLEVGPRGNLTGFVDDILAGRDYAAIPLDLPSRGGIEQLLHALARLCAHGITPDTTPLFARRQPAPIGDAPSGGRPDNAPKRRPLKLKMDIPSLSLAPEDTPGLRQAILGSLAAPRDPAAAPLPPPAGGTAAEEILRSHQDTMRRILDAHQSVMRAATRGGTAS
jgi:acyl transferase domain-containing protein